VCYAVEQLRAGATYNEVPAQIYPAGKALNAARVMRTLGERVTLLGIMPRDSSRQFESFCQDHGIGTSFHAVEGGVRINATISEEAVHQTTHVSSRGPHYPVRIQDEFLAFARQHLRRGDTWVLSGSLPSGFENSFYQALVRECREQSITAVLDARAEALRMGVRAKPDVIKPNLSELESYFGEQIEGIRHIALKAKRLLDMGIGYVFVSLGSDGMIATHENDCLLCSVPQVRAVDTVGCGDALVAGLVVGLARHFSFAETCRMACACGVSNALHPGPGSVQLDEVGQIMEEITIENA
jgi:tagatose 6-phosphate kinase